jgi:hypothetical protein
VASTDETWLLQLKGVVASETQNHMRILLLRLVVELFTPQGEGAQLAIALCKATCWRSHAQKQLPYTCGVSVRLVVLSRSLDVLSRNDVTPQLRCYNADAPHPRKFTPESLPGNNFEKYSCKCSTETLLELILSGVSNALHARRFGMQVITYSMHATTVAHRTHILTLPNGPP